MTLDQFNNNYQNNVKAIHNFALQLTSSRVDADDLVQETAIKAFRFRNSFHAGSSFKSWTFTILKNTFITQYKKRKKMSKINAHVEDCSYVLEHKNLVHNDAVSNMKVKEIEACIGLLSKKCGEPFQMYLDGYQYDEIAEKLDIPIGTVKSRLSYARKKLKTVMASHGLESE